MEKGKNLPLFGSPLSGLPYLRKYRVKRVSSWDTTGGNKDWWEVAPGERKVLADIQGPACIKHIWTTLFSQDPHYLRTTLLRAYWDGEEDPSIDSPIGDFFGIGHGIAKHFISLPLTMTCDKGFNCYFPMPFNKSGRIEVVNESGVPLGIYFHIDYEIYDSPLEDVGYFHAKWRREKNPQPIKDGINLTGKENYLILEAKGHGHFVGCILSVHGLAPDWWGEGDDMIFIDDDVWPPSLHGTGTEDYFCAAWGFNREFYGPYHGFPLKGNEDWTGKHSAYRFHIEEPIVFHKYIRVTIEHGHANDRGDDLSSVAYWYQTEPHYNFSPMPPVEERIPREG